jgi:hypothetical protein
LGIMPFSICVRVKTASTPGYSRRNACAAFAQRSCEPPRFLPPPLELGLAHLAATHREVGVADSAEPTNMAVDRNVVGRIREHELRLGVVQQSNICSRISRIRAEEAVRSKFPQIARTGYGRTGLRSDLDWVLSHGVEDSRYAAKTGKATDLIPLSWRFDSVSSKGRY